MNTATHMRPCSLNSARTNTKRLEQFPHGQRQPEIAFFWVQEDQILASKEDNMVTAALLSASTLTKEQEAAVSFTGNTNSAMDKNPLPSAQSPAHFAFPQPHHYTKQ